MSTQASVVENAIASARKDIADLLDREAYLRPLCIKIAFYDAISYNPIAKVDGPNGSIRIWEGLAADVEMKKAITTLDDFKRTGNLEVWSYVSHADLYQLAGIEAVKKASGPSLDFQHGRMDSCIPISNKLTIINDDSSADDVKATFHRIGFTDKEIVALSSAYYYWMNYKPLSRSSSSNVEESNISNSYYIKLCKEIEDKQPNKSTTPTSSFRYLKCLVSDASFRKHVELFAKDQSDFAKEYASAHKKLSELGFKYFPQPVPTEAEYHDVKHGIAFAVAMTILFGFVGFFYEVMRT